MELKKQIGKRIQNIRKSKGITQEGLAEMIGIEVPSLSNIETGKYSPSIETLQKLATTLNVKAWEFYYVEEISVDEMCNEINTAIKTNEKLTKSVYNFLKCIQIYLHSLKTDLYNFLHPNLFRASKCNLYRINAPI